MPGRSSGVRNVTTEGSSGTEKREIVAFTQNSEVPSGLDGNALRKNMHRNVF